MGVYGPTNMEPAFLILESVPSGSLVCMHRCSGAMPFTVSIARSRFFSRM